MSARCSWCDVTALLIKGLCRTCGIEARQDRDYFIEKDEADE